MASTSNSLILGDGEVTLYDPCSKIIEDYSVRTRRARMDNTDNPKSFYIVYSTQHYGTSDQGDACLVPSDPSCGSSETVITPFDIESALGYDVRDPAIILFEHAYYKGNSRQYRSSQRDLSSSFPSGWAGVSSYIVTGGKWKLYGAKNMKAPHLQTVTKGPCYFIGSDNDKVMSIERVDV